VPPDLPLGPPAPAATDNTAPSDGSALCLVDGDRLPLHATSAGKILLATGHGPRRERTGALDDPARQPR